MLPTAGADVVIVGAGIAGLSAAHHLRQQGAEVCVLERARGVGGRCASRQVDGILVDHGVGFLHASSPTLLQACQQLAVETREWPQRSVGNLAGLRPQIFHPGVRRLGFTDGINSLVRGLAGGVNVVLEAKVTAIEPGASGFCAQLEDGSRLRAAALVLALAAEQTATLLRPLGAAWPELGAASDAVGAIHSMACDALIAVYEAAPELAWDILVPDASPALSMVANESSKRATGAATALIYTGTASPAGAVTIPTKEASAAALLQAAGRCLGPWAARPRAQHLHRWGLGQVPAGGGLPAPIHLVHPQGGQLGLCGDFLAAGGGVEGAWLSGQMLAQQLGGQGR